MLLILSGEGASDMGGADEYGVRPGPMAHIVDMFVDREFDFSPIVNELVIWVSRLELSRVCKSENLKPHMLLPGAKREAGYVGYTKHAAALAWKARESELAEGDSCVAVMFRDSDGTQSAAHHHWENVVNATEAGFKAMDFPRGVPMIPKPKQEAWLLCAKKPDSYQHCHLLEQESGNDHCPNPLKDQLADLCGGAPTTETLCEWITEGSVDLDRIDMPSFNRFREAMSDALSRV